MTSSGKSRIPHHTDAARNGAKAAHGDSEESIGGTTDGTTPTLENGLRPTHAVQYAAQANDLTLPPGVTLTTGRWMIWTWRASASQGQHQPQTPGTTTQREKTTQTQQEVSRTAAWWPGGRGDSAGRLVAQGKVRGVSNQLSASIPV